MGGRARGGDGRGVPRLHRLHAEPRRARQRRARSGPSRTRSASCPTTCSTPSLGSDLGDRAAGHDDRERGGRRAPLPPRVDRGAPAAEVAACWRSSCSAPSTAARRCTPTWSATGRSCSGSSLAGIPISVAIAVLRYRLYAIDHIISRTVSWAVITAVLVAVFVGGVLGLQAAAGGGHAGADARRRRVHARRRVALFQPHPRPRPARRRPALRSRALRCRAHGDELRRIGSAARSRSTRSRTTCRRPSTARCGRRPRACGCGSRGTARWHRARNGHRTTAYDDAAHDRPQPIPRALRSGATRVAAGGGQHRHPCGGRGRQHSPRLRLGSGRPRLHRRWSPSSVSGRCSSRACRATPSAGGSSWRASSSSWSHSRRPPRSSASWPSPSRGPRSA